MWSFRGNAVELISFLHGFCCFVSNFLRASQGRKGILPHFLLQVFKSFACHPGSYVCMWWKTGTTGNAIRMATPWSAIPTPPISPPFIPTSPPPHTAPLMHRMLHHLVSSSPALSCGILHVQPLLCCLSGRVWAEWGWGDPATQTYRNMSVCVQANRCEHRVHLGCSAIPVLETVSVERLRAIRPPV